jgi:hypothetical protein
MVLRLPFGFAPLSALKTSLPRFVASLLLGFVASACGGDDDPAPTSQDSIMLANENQYESTASLDVPSIETAVTDLSISWDALDEDLQCHGVELPSGIRNLTLLRFENSEAEVAERLSGEPISANELYDVYYGYKTEGEVTSAKLSDFTTLTGSETFDVDESYVEGDITYLLIALSSEALGVGARSMAFLRPTADSLVDEVSIESGCGILDFTAEFQEPLSVPTEGPWVLDWSEVEVDGQGIETSFAGVDRLLVGFYPDRDVQSIEENIFDIELDASPLYELELRGAMSADLGDARDRESGEKFSGFEQDGEGTWLVALTCSACQNPQPILMTVLEPTAP